MDYKALVANLRTHFNQVANADSALKALAFEEAMADRRGGADYNLKLAQVLFDGVPDLKPHVFTIALMARHSSGMIGDMMQSWSAEERALYQSFRQIQSPFALMRAAPDVWQVSLATMIVGIEETCQRHAAGEYMPFAHIQRMLMNSENVAYILKQKPGASGSAQLESRFLQCLANLEPLAKSDNFFGRGAAGGKPRP